MRRPAGPVAALAAGLLLLALYAATLAPGVTFWDAGELAAAAATLGIPHPPGTPLYVALAHVVARAVGAPTLVSWAVGAALFSAICSAAAGALLAALVARWTRSATAGVAAALAAGATSSVWANATETEVYAASLLLSAAMLWCGDRRAAYPAPGEGADGRERWSLLLAYLFALAPALHLSALVAAPAAIALGGSEPDGRVRWREGAMLVGIAVLSAGVGTASATVVAAGALVLGAVGLLAAPPATRRRALAAVALAVLGASALLVLLVRARQGPTLDQGDPSTLARLVDVVGRHQYERVGILPRRAPLWLQLGNLFEYADWQWALGLAGGVEPSWRRTPFTLLYAALGWYGAREHRRLDRRSWRALLLLLLGGSVGVALYLNLKAGPSFGIGVLPDDAPHEARERDYFFVLAFWTWGAWAGLGAARLAARGGAWRAIAALAILPVALGWRAANRRGGPESSTATALALEMLRSAPPRAVLFTAGDNDSYPLWYAQLALGTRRDVTVVTIPLLAAPWYRDELARRDTLIAPGEVSRWRGEGRTVGAVAAAARRAGRPVAVSIALPATEREAAAPPVGSVWSLRGLTWVARPADVEPRPPGVPWATADDSAMTALAAHALRALVAGSPRPSPDGAPRAMHALLACPSLALDAARGGAVAGEATAPDSAPGVLLDSRCNRR